jgi:hypothetical protein
MECDLAVAVLRSALRDIAGERRVPACHRKSAEAFFTSPDSLFKFWCDVAGVEAAVVRAMRIQTRAEDSESQRAAGVPGIVPDGA